MSNAEVRETVSSLEYLAEEYLELSRKLHVREVEIVTGPEWAKVKKASGHVVWSVIKSDDKYHKLSKALLDAENKARWLIASTDNFPAYLIPACFR